MAKYTENLRNRVMTRGPIEGYCAICGGFGKLTRDHVPPKGCNNAIDAVLQTFPQSHSRKSTGWSLSQGGTHFRTLCNTCNTDLLGTRYDPELVELSNQLTQVALSSAGRRLELPAVTTVHIKPQKIARAVVGHLLAANAVEEAKKGLVSAPFPDALRRYFLDETEALPENIDILWWIYPYRRQVVIKSSGKMSTKGGGTIYGHILKFLPLGFWVLWERPAHFAPKVPTLVRNKNMGAEEIARAKIALKTIPPPDFPEAPADDEAIFVHAESTSVGTPKQR